MKFLSLLAIFAAAVAAIPVSTETTQSEAVGKNEFHLKTIGSDKPDHNDLYVVAYHTGAGLNDAVLTKDAASASSAYLNGTRALFDLGTSFPWGMLVGGDTNYASWDSVVINAGEGNTGFGITDDLFHWNHKEGFGGWLVCQWFHNAPQLFWLNRFYNAYIPCSCSKVELKAIYK